MGDAAHFRETARHCYRLATKGRIRPETAQRWAELGDEYMAKAAKLDADEWPGSDLTKKLRDFAGRLADKRLGSGSK